MVDGRDQATTPIETTLRDGTKVLVRPVVPDDRDELAEGFDKLSARSRYLRFHTAVEELTDAQLDYLTQVDQVDHVAWVAIDLGAPDRPGIGVARFVRLAGEPHVAEAAITVADAYQGRGLGTFLLRVLADTARARGITTFRAYVLGENTAMLGMLEQLGPTHQRRGQGVYEIDVALDGEGEHVVGETSVAGRILHAVTGKQVPAMQTTAPPVWVDDTDDAAQRTWHERLDRLLVRRRPDPGDPPDDDA